MVNLTKNIDRDKLEHFIGSYIALVFCSVFVSDWISYLIVIGLVVYKDVIHDLFLKKGKFELKDMFFGSLPIVFDIISKL